jgi:prepilin-type N-terminal cleavage/methylation domain-containing protein
MRTDRGFVLLEVLLALLLLGSAGVELAWLVRSAIAAEEHARTTEARTAPALTLMDYVSLWPRGDLDRHLGERPQGPWRVTIQRVSPQLYAVTIADSSAALTVRTVLYRPPSAHDER